ncbi:MAG: ABC transporter permease [Rhizobiaceae bacterium]
MTGYRFPWQAILAILLALAAWAGGAWSLPEATVIADPTISMDYPFLGSKGLIAGLLVVGGLAAMPPRVGDAAKAFLLFVVAHAVGWLLIDGIRGFEGDARWPFFAAMAAAWLLAWLCVDFLSGLKPVEKWTRMAIRLLVPIIFGAWILILWEAVTRGGGVPFVLLPPPSLIGVRFPSSLPTLWADLQQTFFKSVLVGYVLGCALGFLTAVLADWIPFLRRGLLPIGNMVAALPIIGVAPVMVMWFGFDWQSKAAVVVIMTFFPMLVNTLAGLAAPGQMERDLMRTYASDYWQTLTKLRLPAAAPFIFNALKINSTLAMIGAIVAEFFGTPIVGMGFRISTEVGRMNVDMVWAEIAVAAIVGSVFYGVVALVERAATFWHPSVRGG